jgi:V/A-type H+-transporting ATPase subunit I
MFTPESMDQLHIVFHEQDIGQVADMLVRHGGLQPVDMAAMETWAETLPKAGSGEESAQLRDKKDRIETLFHQLEEVPDFNHVSAHPEESDPDQRLAKLQKEFEHLLQEQETSGRELNRLRELLKRIEEMPKGLLLNQNEAYSYLAVETGKITRENLPILQQSLKPVLHVISPVAEFTDSIIVVVIALRRDREKIRKAMHEAGSQPIQTPGEADTLTPEAIRKLRSDVRENESRFNELEEQLNQWKKNHLPFLNQALFQIRREVLMQQILRYFRKTDHTYLISGWIPSKDREGFMAEMRRVTKNRCVIEKQSANEIEAVRQGKLEVPVQLKNPKVFKPFELIIGAYGLPAYRTIDPTPILGLSFMIMFGIMFGDVGHGLVLALLGIALIIRRKTEFQKNAGLLICYVSASSIFFGFMFGSLFGFEHLSWLPPLWIKPMESIETLFKFCIYFGIGMIFLSIVINLINNIRLKRYWSILFDNAGFIAGLLYWSGIVLASRIVTSSVGEKNIFIASAPILMGIALVLLFFREPIVHLAQGKKQLYAEGALTGIVSGIIELLEISLGFLANTVSFIRIAAFGLVHAGLAMAIFSLSDSMGSVGSVVMIIFGNLFIIMLEGLVVTIQSVRLEFYEFFSRFFKEGKARYRPLKTELIQ